MQCAIDAGADAVGFVFADSPRRVTAQYAASISRAVPATVKRVAVMLHPDAAAWDEVAAVFQPDVLQTDIEDFAGLNVADSIERWPVLREGTVSAQQKLPKIFIYEGKKSGRGETVDWQAAAHLAPRGGMILAGGLRAENVAQAIAAVAPFGVDVSSAVESQPGKKDAAKIRAFIAAVKATDHHP